MGEAHKKVIVVMPAYNAASTLEDTYRDIPDGWVDEVILVDDASRDDTVVVSQRLGIETIVHPHNRGYGANQKTCYMTALERGADIVIMLHPDGQYDPAKIPEMVTAISSGEADIVLGSRFLTPGGAIAGGMPRYKYIFNRLLTWIENRAMGTALSECHTGYRAYSRELLQAIPFSRNSDDFVFDTQILFQAKHFGFRFAEVPVETRYFPEASSVGMFTSIRYGIKTLKVVVDYVFQISGIKHVRYFSLP